MIVIRKRVIRVAALFGLVLFVLLCLSVVTPPADRLGKAVCPVREMMQIAPQVALAHCDDGDPGEMNPSVTFACNIRPVNSTNPFNDTYWGQHSLISWGYKWECDPPSCVQCGDCKDIYHNLNCSVTPKAQDLDWFEIWLNPGETLTVDLDALPSELPLGSQFRIGLHADKNGNCAKDPSNNCVDVTDTIKDGSISFTYTSSFPTYYYLWITNTGCNGRFEKTYVKKRYDLGGCDSCCIDCTEYYWHDDWTYNLYIDVRKPAPATPAYLEANPAGEKRIDVTWVDIADETRYYIERAPDAGGAPGAWAALGQTNANNTTYSDTTVACGVTYWYRVRAFRQLDGQYSAYSNTDSATTTCLLPSDPTNLTATAISPDQINLTWSDNSDNETAFHIERAPDVGGSPGTWMEIGTNSPNDNTYTDSGLASQTTYHYRVRAYRSGIGFSGYTTPASATTLAGPTPTAGPTATTPPTPTPSPTPDMGNPADIAEPNNDFPNAFRLAPGNSIGLNFNSGIYGVDDIDFFIMSVKEGVTYTCETSDLGLGADTVLFIYGPNASEDNVLAYNDDIDIAKGNIASRVTWDSGYNGEAYIVVRHNGALAMPGMATYTLTCYIGQAKSGVPSGGGGGGGSGAPAAPGPKSAVKIEIVDVPTRVPVPTPAPLGTLTVDILIAYDENANGITDLSEGVYGISVRAINTRNNRQLASGFTDQYGSLQLIVTASQEDDVLVVVPYLSIGKIFRVGQTAKWQVLIPSATLPGLIP